MKVSFVTQVKLKVDKTGFKCNVTAGSSLKTDWAGSITAV